MILVKDGKHKEIKNPKVAERLQKDGWVSDEPKKEPKKKAEDK